VGLVGAGLATAVTISFVLRRIKLI